MKKRKKYFSLLFLLPNIYSHLVWTIVYNKYSVQQIRVQNFLKYFPGFSLSILNWALILFTITSIILLTKYFTNDFILGKVILILQFCF